MKPTLTKESLISEAYLFCQDKKTIDNKLLYGITDGKAIGTYIEQKFSKYLSEKYTLKVGSSALGIDLPADDILTDIKVTSVKQPQSSCPFRDAKQKIFGLGYNLLIFVYDKKDNLQNQTTILNFVSCSFIEKERTADYTTTFRLRQMVADGANEEYIVGYLMDRNIPADEIALYNLARQIIENPPLQGYLTISNALQWRLQYQRVVDLNIVVEGIHKIIDKNPV